MVKYLENRDIDRAKWDRCIENSCFETLYPYSWYLDLVSPGWEGLVKDDYDLVMPLTITRKLGIKMLLQPILAQQLGIFGADSTTGADVVEFLSAIPGNIRVYDICLNRCNTELPEGIRATERINYELDLSSEPAYNTNTKRNLQKGNENSFDIREIKPEVYIDLKFSTEKNVPISREYMHNLFTGLAAMKHADVFGLCNGDDILAGAVLGYARSRAIYMNGCSSGAGKDSRAMFVLMDYLINLSRERYPVFDFEGSNISGVARFFEGFGAEKTIYLRIQKGKPPFMR